MKVRLVLVCTLLLLAAAPSFALPLCEECTEWATCEAIPGSIERCFEGAGYCYTTPDRCSPALAATVLTEWKVVSIEVSHPSQDSVTVTTPARVAQNDVVEPELVEPK